MSIPIPVSAHKSLWSALALNPIQPYWNKQEQPHFYTRTDTLYHSVAWADILPSRGIYNPVLTNLAVHLPPGAFIAGGFVASVLRCDKDLQASDIDIFFNSPEAFDQTYRLLCGGAPAEAWSLKDYEPNVNQEDLENNSKKVKLVKFTSKLPDKLPIQLVKMIWYEDCRHVIDSFDFTATQFAIHGADFIYNPLAFLDLSKKTLVSHRHHYPADTLFRMIKYVNKGYHVPPASLLVIADAIKKSDVTDPPMLNRFYDDKPYDDKP